MKIRIPDSAKDFYDIIPTNVAENIEFRIKLHQMCAVDPKLQQVFMEMCRQYIPIFFSTVAWTYNPWTRLNFPFILRPAQIPAVETVDWGVETGHDIGINKSREEGASEICCKIVAAKALLHEYVNFIIGSRKKELVDNFGDYYTLFAKIDNVFECLPTWWKKISGYDPNKNRKDMLLTIPQNSSSIVGETTNESFSAGSRATALLLDEFGRVDAATATAIEGSVHDVAPCIIYSSTHWLGAGHCFNQCLGKATTKVIELLWYDNPTKNQGLYTSPEPGMIQLLDIDYYKELAPKLFKSYRKDDILDIDDIKEYLPEGMNFIADGCRGLPQAYRGPWHDYQELRRKGNKRDFISNVWATPMGASETPFDHAMLTEIKKRDIRPPDFKGELKYSQYSTGRIDEYEISFIAGHGRFNWWGELPFGRPEQRHNYIIAIDPSYGLGSANSAIMIYDVNNGEQVGSWADASTKPETLADIAVAMAYWCGGIRPPLLVWDSGGGCGTVFTNRVIFLRYPYLYTQRREDAKTRKMTQKWGWIGTGKRKDGLFGELAVALSSGLSGTGETYKSLIIHDVELADELFDYVFRDKGAGCVVSKKADLSTGALERHGDRVITAGLCILACEEQLKGNWKESKSPPINSFQYRFNKINEEEEKLKQDKRTYLF